MAFYTCDTWEVGANQSLFLVQRASGAGARRGSLATSAPVIGGRMQIGNMNLPLDCVSPEWPMARSVRP